MKQQLFISFALGMVLGLCIWWAQAAFADFSSNDRADVEFVVTGEANGVLQGYLVVQTKVGWIPALPSNPKPMMPVN